MNVLITLGMCFTFTWFCCLLESLNLAFASAVLHLGPFCGVTIMNVLFVYNRWNAAAVQTLAAYAAAVCLQ